MTPAEQRRATRAAIRGRVACALSKPLVGDERPEVLRWLGGLRRLDGLVLGSCPACTSPSRSRDALWWSKAGYTYRLCDEHKEAARAKRRKERADRKRGTGRRLNDEAA
jgi:hypothetical protein